MNLYRLPLKILKTTTNELNFTKAGRKALIFKREFKISSINYGEFLTWLVAHRGGAALEMENTQKAFDRAISCSVDGLECDLQLSKDGVPLLFHDRTLYKFKLYQKRIKQFTWSDIQSFKAKPYRKWKISGRDILSYENFLKRYRDQSRLFIELKSRKGDQIDGTSKKIIQSILEVHQKVKPLKETFFMSFDHNLMRQVSEVLPAYHHILLSENPKEISCRDLKSFFGVGLPLQKVNAEVVSKFHRRNLKVLVYTCNGPRQLQQMKKAGVDIIVSDRPDWVTQIWQELT